MPTKLTIYAIVAALLLVGGFAAGWLVNGWRSDANDAAQARERARSAVEALEAASKDLKDRVEKLDTFNSESARLERENIEALRRTQRAIAEIQDEIARTNVGGARISSDGDRLRNNAYRTAFPPAADP